MTPSIRIWPALLILAGMLLMMTLPGFYMQRTMVHFAGLMAAPSVAVMLLGAWWLGFSRAVPYRSRWVTVGLLVAVSVLACLPALLIDRTPPMNIFFYGFAAVSAVWVGWIALTFLLPVGIRIRGTNLIIAAVLGFFSVLRVEGTSAGMYPEFSAIWSKRPEELARDLNMAPLVPGQPLPDASSPPAAADWPEFRGPRRDGIDRVSTIETDWDAHPPRLLWKQKIGPGWGSFSVVGGRLFTQEQRGPQEAVVCYDAATGGQIWRYFEDTYFKETISGAGPRATPTVLDGRVYAQGTTGMMVCLDAGTGELIWKTDIREATGAQVPTWGFSSSPLVMQGVVITYAGAPDKGTIALDKSIGKLVWTAGQANYSYSSPHRLDDKTVLMVSNLGLEAIDAETGTVIWTHAWKIAKEMNRTCQPAILPGGDMLISTGVGNEQGLQRIERNGTSTSVRWQSRHMRAYFNDGVIYQNHYYGIDGRSLACINLEDGSLRWNAGTKYGEGQVLVMEQQGILLVLSVDGTVALVEAKPGEYNELARMKALQGKTWNHPVVAGGRLFIRNANEAAAYELPRRASP